MSAEILSEYFQPVRERQKKHVLFYRISGYSRTVEAFLRQYYEQALQSGVVLDGKIPNPEPGHLSYYAEIMGSEFRLDQAFFQQQLQKWLPRMKESQSADVSEALFSALEEMQRSGKNLNMLKNAYVKDLCWLYYKFERITNRLGEAYPPKILYCGDITANELHLLTVLSSSGADVLLVEPNGDAAYRLADPSSRFSSLYDAEPLEAFPPSFSLKKLQQEKEREQNRSRLYDREGTQIACTNAWMNTPTFHAVERLSAERGGEERFFYNVFLCQTGVEDKLTYKQELYQLVQTIQQQKRAMVVVNQQIFPPTPEETAQIVRTPCSTAEQLVSVLLPNLSFPANSDLQGRMRNRFTDLILEQGETLSIQKLTNRAVSLICWMRRYQAELFSRKKTAEMPVFLLFGRCGSEMEALFLRFLSLLPVDVLLLIPDRQESNCLQDKTLLMIQQEQSYPLETFPVSAQTGARVGTVAYEAEQELNTLLYQDSGLYRSHQHTQSTVVTLQTMLEEIPMLWTQELKYRPNFGTDEEKVTMPVLMEKICGVKNGDVNAYWTFVRQLCTPETVLVRGLPWLPMMQANPMKPHATHMIRNGRLLRDAIREHPAYPYGILREETQEYLLDKLQLLLDQKLIRGTYVNGTEYTIIATVLNLEKELVRRIQAFDFTRKNPKLVFLLMDDRALSLEESIVTAFLHLIGFDILFFVPTGYRCIETHFVQPPAAEEQIGPYLFDLSIPDLNRTIPDPGRSVQNLKELLFGRRKESWH